MLIVVTFCQKTVGQHFQKDVESILYDGWDLMIGHPPCTRTLQIVELDG